MQFSFGQAHAGQGQDGRGQDGRMRGSFFRNPGELAIMILGFMMFWPLGLSALGYFFWRSKMGCGWKPGTWRMDRRFEEAFQNMRSGGGSGNAAFDDYRGAVLKRLDEERRKLDEEQMAFRAFMERLRRAKDQEEFDRFMAERNGGGNPEHS